MNKLTIAFYSTTANSGKRTLSQSMANLLAKRGYKTLYVELDYLNPSFAITSGLTHAEKNLYKVALEQRDFDVNSYIATKDDVLKRGKKKAQLKEISPDFHFLAFPNEFRPEYFPKFDFPEEFVDELLTQIKNADYEVVILNIPNSLRNMFCFPVLLEADHVLNVMLPHPARVVEYIRIKALMESKNMNLKKWKVVFNQVEPEMDPFLFRGFVNEKDAHVILRDGERQAIELDLKVGSPLIYEGLELLCDELELKDKFKLENDDLKRKKIFGLI